MNNFKTLPTKEVELDGEVYLQINLQDALDKLPLQLLYYKEHGHSKFIIVSSSTGSFSYSHMFGKIIKSIYKLVDQHDIEIVFTGFPRCIFEHTILPPQKKWYFSKSIKFLEENGEELEKPEQCMFCNHTQKCKGVVQEYLKKHKPREFIPLLSNSKRVDLYSQHIKELGSDELIGIAEFLLDDLGRYKTYQQRNFYFLTSYPSMSQEKKREGVGYFIYNDKAEFEENLELFVNIYSFKYLHKIKEFLRKSPEFLMKFELLEDCSLRKSLEFSTEYLDTQEIIQLEKLLDIKIDEKMVVLYETEPSRAYKREESIQIPKIKELMKDIPLERKRNILRYLNSLMKPLKDFIYFKDEETLSFLVSIDKNACKVHQLAQLFSLNLSYLRERKLSHLHFEVYKDKDEKVTFLYAFDEQKELTKEEEEEDYYEEEENY